MTVVRAIAGGVSCFSCGHLALDEDLYHTDPETAEPTQLCRLCYEAKSAWAMRQWPAPPTKDFAEAGDAIAIRGRNQVKKHQVYHTMIESNGPKRRRGMWLLAACVVLLSCRSAAGAGYATENFVVQAETPRIAKAVAETAEAYRNTHWQQWFGHDPPGKWSFPCQIDIKITDTDGGGSTSFVFADGSVFGWQGTWTGRYERLLDDVVPHEVMHCVLASEFLQPLPRWISEGICTTVESPHGRNNWARYLPKIARENKLIPIGRLMSLREYPPNAKALYSQGQALVDYLLAIGGRERLIEYCREGFKIGWEDALTSTYSIAGANEFGRRWLAWHRGGEKTEVYFEYRRQINCPPGRQCGPGNLGTGYWIPQDQITNQGSQGLTLNPRLYREQPSKPPQQPIAKAPVPTPAKPPVVSCACEDLWESLSDWQLSAIEQTKQAMAALQTEFESKLAAGEFVNRGDLPQFDKFATKYDLAFSESSLPKRVQELLAQGVSGLGGTAGKALVTTLGISGPVGWGILAAATAGGLLIGQRLKRGFRGNTLNEDVAKTLGAASSAETFQPIERDLDEARQLLQLSQLEGRDPLQDAIAGRLALDRLDAIADSERDPQQATWADRLRRELRERFNEIAPTKFKANVSVT